MVVHAIPSGLRFREVISHIAKLFRALRKPVLPTFPFSRRQRVIDAAVELLTSQLPCLGCAFVAAPSRLLCRRDKRLIDEAADCF